MPVRILFAEDDPSIRLVAQVALRRAGFVVTAVEDGEAAVRAVRQQPFDLVILDGMMPKLDGLSACRRIREDEATRDLPIVILSARSQNTDEASALAAGATAYIKKPFDAITLGDRLREILGERQALSA